jgi:RNA polymerase sigma factor (sigma-70 family)
MMGPDEINELIREHVPYARTVARSFARRGFDLEDLVQEALIAMWQAAKDFRPDDNPGVQFVSFARPFVVRRLGELTCALAVIALPADICAPSDPHGEKAAGELWSAMDVLSDLERNVLIRRYELDGQDAGIELLCKRLKLSYRRVMEIAEEARAKLKAELVKRGWRDRSKPAAGRKIKAG